MITTSRNREARGVFVCTAAFASMLLAGTAYADMSLAQDRASNRSATNSLEVVEPLHGIAMLEHEQELDRQIAHLHARLDALIETEDRQRETTGDFASTPITAPPLPHPSNVVGAVQDARAEQKEKGVVQMEQEVIGEDHLDPFDEETGERVDDPWEAFNMKTFAFNRTVDRYIFKPVATGYDWIIPDPAEQAISNAFQNVRFVPRFLNNLLQGKGRGASIELGRFVINSTVGLAGFFDVAKDLGLDPPDGEDTGQTLAAYGVKSGPYLVLPLLPPTTVRDGVGFLGDLAMDPLSFVVPFIPQISARSTEIVSERSRNLERFEGVEEATVDPYAAVRDAYLQKRAKAIQE